MQLSEALARLDDCSESWGLDGESDELGNACTVLWVHLVEVLNHALLNVTTAFAETTSDVSDSLLTHLLVENLAEEGARLLVVIVLVLVSVAAGLTLHVLLGPGIHLVLNRGAGHGVWLIIWLRAVAAIYGHEAVAGVVVTHACAVWAVNGDLIIVGSESVAVGVWVVDEATLEHLVVAGLNTWDLSLIHI